MIFWRRIFPSQTVPGGRLDKDTEGLIFLTDDGKMAHRLLSPKNRVDKTYYVEVRGNLVKGMYWPLKLELSLRILPHYTAKLDILEVGDVSKAYVTICEGKFHQIKRMMKSVGKEVIYLKRLSLGPLQLDKELAPGQWRDLTDEELCLLSQKSC